MPFKSQAQRAYFWKFMPTRAKEWEGETPKGKTLPKKIKSVKGKKNGTKKKDCCAACKKERGSKPCRSKGKNKK